ncbi:MAG: hypothetical protein KDB61_07845, partial [Planctomycetes bacterium]|nr:hypothetical protein [Planctomycetota bacterium]
MSVSGHLGTIRGVLAAEGAYSPGRSDARWRVLLGCVVFGGLLYGACMGSWQVRPLQQLYSAIKTPILVSAGGIFCLPSFFVINNLLGLRDDL